MKSNLLESEITGKTYISLFSFVNGLCYGLLKLWFIYVKKKTGQDLRSLVFHAKPSLLVSSRI